MQEISRKIQLLSALQAYRAEKRAFAAGTKSLDLMESAGKEVFAAIAARYRKSRVLVASGPGNNGGDGFVAARLLHENGWPVTLALSGNPQDLQGDALLSFEKIKGIEPVNLIPKLAGEHHIIIDALFGIGLKRNISGGIKDFIIAANESPAIKIAVDIPSGVNSDTGEIMGVALKADITVTFIAKKLGQALMPGKEYCGEVILKSLAIDEKFIEGNILENNPQNWLAVFPKLNSRLHKYKRGHTLVMGAAISKTGASKLVALAALRIGAGVATVASPKESIAVYGASLIAPIIKEVEDVRAWRKLIKERKIAACVVGPNCGVDQRTFEFTLAAVESGIGIVIDADAITVFADENLGGREELFAAIKANGNIVMTPHEGEFKKLFGAIDSRLEAAKRAASLSGAVIVLKGADTIIAEPSGMVAVNTNAPATLATAGSGDVLAGIIGGLLANRMPVFEAACAGAWIHGEAANHFGPGLISEDLPGLIPEVLKDLI